MTVLQLVRTDADGPNRIEPRLNPGQKAPDEFEDEGVHAFEAGSDDLIAFAVRLSHSGFKVLEVSLMDRFFTEVDEGTKEEVEPRFRRLLSADAASVERFKDQFLSDLFVNHIRLRNKTTGNVIVIGQEGVVHADIEEIEPLTAGLNEV